MEIPKGKLDLMCLSLRVEGKSDRFDRKYYRAPNMFRIN